MWIVHLQGLLQAPPAVYGLALGVLGVLVLALVLPRDERRLVRGPIALLLVYASARSAVGLFPPTDLAPKVLRFIAAFAWCAGLVRSVFVLLSSSRVTRYVPPWPKILRDIVQGLLYFGIALISLRAIGVEPGSLLTTSALLTAVLGLSMQETLGNLFAGLALQSQKAFEVGDWVRFADGPEGVGEVTEVNWRATHFLTTTRVQVVVPNAVLARATVRNYSRPTPVVRYDTQILLPFSVSPDRVQSVILGALRGVDGVLSDPEPFLMVGAFGESGVTYTLCVFLTDYGRRDRIESAVRRRVLYALRRAGIAVPFPRRQVYFDGQGPLAAMANGAAARASDHARKDDFAARLGRMDVFRDLEQGVLARLGESTYSMLYEPGEAIIRQGERGTELYALERGRVDVVVDAENGAPVNVTVLEAGAVFGEAAFLTSGPRVATIVALTECEVLVVPQAALLDLLQNNRPLAERLSRMLAERMDQLNQALNRAAQEGLDEERRGDVLFERIRHFFGQ